MADDFEQSSGIDGTLRADAILVPTSFGDLIDKMTILEIKAKRIADEEKITNVLTELTLLQDTYASLGDFGPKIGELNSELYEINEVLWDIEESVRACELRQDFGIYFIQLARSVYVTNDRRAAIKRALNDIVRSFIAEEKSHKPY